MSLDLIQRQKFCSFVISIYLCKMLSLLFYIYLVFICTIFLVLSFVAWILFTPFDPARRIIHGLSRVLVKLFFMAPPYWRQRIEGLESIDPSKRYVVVINHNSMLDIPVLYNLPLNFRWVSKREVFQIPFFGQFLLLHGDIAISRGSGAAAMAQVVQEGCEWIDRGASIAIFPEGTRSKDGEIGRFKVGAFNLAKAAGCEILPVVIDGTREILDAKGRFNWRSVITLRVLPPVSLESEESEVAAERDLAMARNRAVIAGVREDMIAALGDIRGGERDEVAVGWPWVNKVDYKD